MATRSTSTAHSQRHFYPDFQVNRTLNNMHHGDGIGEHNSDLQRSAFRGLEPTNHQNQYQWRRPASTQPTTVFDRLGYRHNVQDKYKWRNPESSKVPEKSFLRWRDSFGHDQKDTHQTQFKDSSPDDNPYPTSSGSGVGSATPIDQPCYQSEKNTSRNILGKAKDEACSRGSALSDNFLSAHQRVATIWMPYSPTDDRVNNVSDGLKVDHRKTYQLGQEADRHEQQGDTSTHGGWGSRQNPESPDPGPSTPAWYRPHRKENDQFEERVFKCLTLFVEQPWSIDDIDGMRRVLSHKSTPVPPEPNLDGLPPGAQVYVEPIRWNSDKSGSIASTSFQNTEHGRKLLDNKDNNPQTSFSRFQTNHQEESKMSPLRRYSVSQHTKPMGMTLSTNQQTQSSMLYRDPQSTAPRHMSNFSHPRGETPMQVGKDVKISLKRKAPSDNSDTKAKQTKLPAIKPSRKRKAVEDVFLETDIVTLIKKPRLI